MHCSKWMYLISERYVWSGDSGQTLCLHRNQRNGRRRTYNGGRCGNEGSRPCCEGRDPRPTSPCTRHAMQTERRRTFQTRRETAAQWPPGHRAANQRRRPWREQVGMTTALNWHRKVIYLNLTESPPQIVVILRAQDGSRARKPMAFRVSVCTSCPASKQTQNILFICLNNSVQDARTKFLLSNCSWIIRNSNTDYSRLPFLYRSPFIDCSTFALFHPVGVPFRLASRLGFVFPRQMAVVRPPAALADRPALGGRPPPQWSLLHHRRRTLPGRTVGQRTFDYGTVDRQ